MRDRQRRERTASLRHQQLRAADPALSRARRLRRLALRVALGALLATAALEIVLQVVQRTVHPPLYELEDPLGWRLRRGLDRRIVDERGRTIRFLTDAEGRRVATRETAAASAGDTVLFVGDSFTMGGQVEADECFAFRVGRELGDEVTTVNAGVGGWSTVQEALALEELLGRHRPRLVVLVVYENDFVDNLMPYFSGLGPRPHFVADGELVKLVPQSNPAAYHRFLPGVPAAFWLYRHSAVFRSVHKNLFLPRHGSRLAELEERERELVPIESQHAAMRAALVEVRARVVRAGARLVVCAVPSREQSSAASAPGSHAWLGTVCAELATPFTSLWAALHENGGAANYYPRDIHFDVRGHATAASALVPFVRAAMR